VARALTDGKDCSNRVRPIVIGHPDVLSRANEIDRRESFVRPGRFAGPVRLVVVDDPLLDPSDDSALHRFPRGKSTLEAGQAAYDYHRRGHSKLRCEVNRRHHDGAIKQGGASMQQD